MDKMIQDLKNIVDIQVAEPTCKTDEYMRGMANGLICALAVCTGEEPEYMGTPEQELQHVSSSMISKITGINQLGSVTI